LPSVFLPNQILYPFEKLAKSGSQRMNDVGVQWNTLNQGLADSMTRRSKVILISAIALLAVVAALTVRWLTDAPVLDPVYQGKKLSSWLQETTNTTALLLGGGVGGASVVEVFTPQAEHAIRALGTNAVPMIWRDLNATNSPAQTRVINLLRRLPIPAVHFTPADVRQARAEKAMYLLGADAGPLAAYLRLDAGKVITNTASLNILFSGLSTITIFNNALNSPDPWVRIRAAIQLIQIDTKTTNHIPVLVNSMLQSRDTKLRGEALRALYKSSLGENERVFHALLRCVQDRDVEIRQLTAGLLSQLAERSRTMFEYLLATAAQTHDRELAQAARDAIEIIERHKMGKPVYPPETTQP
jgi:hypothetical protein